MWPFQTVYIFNKKKVPWEATTVSLRTVAIEKGDEIKITDLFPIKGYPIALFAIFSSKFQDFTMGKLNV